MMDEQSINRMPMIESVDKIERTVSGKFRYFVQAIK